MHNILDKKPLKDTFIFHVTARPNENSENVKDIYFCSCGTRLIKEGEDENESSEVKVRFNTSEGFNFDKTFENSTKAIKIICGNCEKNYSHPYVYNNIFPVNTYFFETYKFIESDTHVFLYKYKAEGLFDVKDNKSVNIHYQYSYISIDKNTKKLYFLDFADESKTDEIPIEFNLSSVLAIIKKFLSNSGQAEIADNLMDIHIFIGALSKYVADAGNINIVKELMSQMIGQSGLDILEKVIAIFCGIICYPNLSTIALTKGTIFLYDMLNDCKLPNPSVLSDNNATSPLKIFNYLVNNTNAEVQAILDSYNSDKVGYLFKSEKTGQEINIHYGNANNRFKKTNKADVQDGKLVVRNDEDLKNKKVSPFIFNKIQKFSDYKTIIRYTKFISYNELIELVSKYDIDLLLNLYPLIEFRADIEKDQVYQFVNLTISWLKRQRLLVLNQGLNKSNTEENKFIREKFIQKEAEDQNKIKYVEEDVKNEDLDMNAIKHMALFGQYDDCLRMIASLKWDPNHEFYKIKHVKLLEEYHDKLIKYFNLLSSSDKNKSYVEFVYKYTYLEEYDGDLEVRLIKSPDMLLNEAEIMHNCAASYITRISEKSYLLFIIRDLNPERKKTEDEKFMFGLKITKYGIEFDQVKAAYNKQGTDRFKRQIMTYLESKDISYKELADLRLSTSKTAASDADYLFNEAMPEVLED